GQTPAAHFAAMHDQRHQKVDGPMTDVLKFPALNFARPHQERWLTPLQDLDVGFLVHCQDDFATLMQPFHPFIEPQNARRPLPKLFVQSRRFPVPRAMRLQRSRAQNQRDGRMRNARHDASLDSDASQRPCRPMGHLQANARRSATGQLFNLDPLQGGESPTAGRTVGHQRWLPARGPRNVDRVAKWQLALSRLFLPTALRLFPGRPWLTRYVRVGLLVARCDHRAPGFQGSADLVQTAQSDVEAASSYATAFHAMVFV